MFSTDPNSFDRLRDAQTLLTRPQFQTNLKKFASRSGCGNVNLALISLDGASWE